MRSAVVGGASGAGPSSSRAGGEQRALVPLSATEAIVYSAQLWRAAGLVPKALQCPRAVFCSEPHPADPHHLEGGPSAGPASTSTPAPLFKRAWASSGSFAQASTSYCGPVDSLEADFGAGGASYPSRKQARTSSGAPHHQQAPQQQHNNTSSSLHSSPPAAGSGRGGRGGKHGYHQRHAGRGAGAAGAATAAAAVPAYASYSAQQDALLPPHLALPQHHQQHQQMLDSQGGLLYSSNQPLELVSDADLEFLAQYPKGRRRGPSRRAHADMSQFSTAFALFACLQSTTPTQSADSAGAYPAAALQSDVPMQEAVSSEPQVLSEDPSGSVSATVSLQSTDTLKGRPLSPSSPLSDGLF